MLFADIAGKTVLVTGASSGLGAHFARLFASHGASVILTARRTDALENVCADIAGKGGKARALPLDVTDRQSVEVATIGLSNVDILINNAGITADLRASDLSEQDWDSVLDTNLKGTFLMAQAAAKWMQGRGGVIVNVASIVGLRVAGNVSAYAASKAGVIQLTKSLALEWARHNIRVNALCPGYIETDINREFFESDAGRALIKRIPQRRLGQAEDLDGAMLLLASDAARYITGATLAVDGGHLVSSL